MKISAIANMKVRGNCRTLNWRTRGGMSMGHKIVNRSSDYSRITRNRNGEKKHSHTKEELFSNFTCASMMHTDAHLEKVQWINAKNV